MIFQSSEFFNSKHKKGDFNNPHLITVCTSYIQWKHILGARNRIQNPDIDSSWDFWAF